MYSLLTPMLTLGKVKSKSRLKMELILHRQLPIIQQFQVFLLKPFKGVNLFPAKFEVLVPKFYLDLVH